MLAVSVHEDVIVVTSRVWQTTCTAVRSGGEAFVIDSPVYPDELEALPGLLEQSQFPVKGLLITHGDWDHMLARSVYPEAPIGCAETTAARLSAEPGAVQRDLRTFDQEHYVQRDAPLSLPEAQALPVPGYCGVGERELELHSAEGHTSDGMAVWASWTGVLVAGDYLSAVELPMLSEGGSLDGYLSTLVRLGDLVEQAGAVVPGHGPVLDRSRALEILNEDTAYLGALREHGPEAPLPPGRDTPPQRRTHEANVELVSGVTVS